MTSIDPFRVVCVVGARPNFMKIAPLIRAFSREPRLASTLLHTGQHYDEAMKASFFEQLDIPAPDVDLEVGSGTHAVQTAEIMRRFEPELERLEAGAVLVVGDVNSTIACALVAAKKDVPVIHVEAGLRSYDRAMPEEINRVLTDQISDLLFTTEEEAERNLLREGIDPARIHFVGNVMIDTLLHNRTRCRSAAEILAALKAPERFRRQEGYGLLTLHRPSNVDDPSVMHRLVEALSEMACELPLVFPMHPRTKARLEAAGSRSKPGRQRVPAVPAALPRHAWPDDGCACRAHRLWRHSRGDDCAGRALHHLAGEHGTADHCERRHQHRGRDRPRAYPCRVSRRVGNRWKARPHSRALGWTRGRAHRGDHRPLVGRPCRGLGAKSAL